MTDLFTLHIDSGHGKDGITAGKRNAYVGTPDGCFEGNDNRLNTKSLIKACEAENVKYIDIVGDSVADVSLKNRCVTSNFFYKDGDILLSNHLNAVKGTWQTKAYGMRILYVSAEGKKLAQCIAQETGASIHNAGKKGFLNAVKSIIVKHLHLYMLNKPKAVANLIEWDFMDSLKGLRHVRANRDQMGINILRGVMRYKGLV